VLTFFFGNFTRLSREFTRTKEGVMNGINEGTNAPAVASPENGSAADETLRPDRAPADETAEGSTGRQRRGFAAMDPKLVSEIARKGGKAAHSAGKAHEFTSAEAREAGRKGGLATHRKRREPKPAEEPRSA